MRTRTILTFILGMIVMLGFSRDPVTPVKMHPLEKIAVVVVPTMQAAQEVVQAMVNLGEKIDLIIVEPFEFRESELSTLVIKPYAEETRTYIGEEFNKVYRHIPLRARIYSYLPDRRLSQHFNKSGLRS